ncbi:glutaminase [Shigella flexneri]
MAIVTSDGNIYSAGDSDYRFALESISKVCTLALALEDVGRRRYRTKLALTRPDRPLTESSP